MIHESDDSKISQEQVDRTLLLWHDESYLRDLVHREEMDKHDRFMEAVRQHKESRAEAGSQAEPDYQAVFEAQVSKGKRIATEALQDHWNELYEAAQREAGQGHTGLPGALKKRFGNMIPIIQEGRVIGLRDPNEKPEHVKEVRKGTRSRQVHKPRTSQSTTKKRALGATQLRIADDDKEVVSLYGKPGETA